MKQSQIAIDKVLLTRLINRLEANLSSLTRAERITPTQRARNEEIEMDIRLIDEARHLLRPKLT